MKRLFEQIGVTYLSVLAVVFYFGTKFAFILAAFAFVATILFLIVRRFRKTVYLTAIALTTLVACIINIVYTNVVYKPVVEKYDNVSGTIVATMTDAPQKNYDFYSYRFTAHSIDNQKCDFDFVVTHNKLLSIEPFDKIKIKAELIKADSASWISKGYFIKADFGYGDPCFTVKSSDEKPLYYDVLKLREKFSDMLLYELNDDAYSLCSALLIGDKGLLGAQRMEDFRKAGVSHVIVVSGMHFSILTSVWFLLAKKFYKLRFLFLSIAATFVVLYMFITGFTPSVMRSSVMMLIYGLSLLISRESYGGNSLGFAAIFVVSFFGPYSAGDVGLILSFASTYAILKLSPLLYSSVSKKLNLFYDSKSPWLKKKAVIVVSYFIRLLCVNICAFAAALPLSIIFFGSVSLISILTSFVIALPVTLLMYLLVVFCLVYFVPFLAFLSPLAVYLIELISEFILDFVSVCAKLDFAYVNVRHDFVYIWLILSALLIIFFVAFTDKKDFRVLVLCVAIIFISGQSTALHFDSKTSALSVYDAGNGTAVMYKNKDVYAMISFECNSKNRYEIIEKLQHSVPHIDFCSSVGDNPNSRNSVTALTQAFAINNILLYDTKKEFIFDFPCIVSEASDDCTVKLSQTAYVRYYKTKHGYATFLKDSDFSVLVLPHLANAEHLPKDMRSCDVIVVSSDIENFKLLRCDTLVVSAQEDMAYSLMEMLCSISKKVMLTTDSDIKILTEV